MPVIGSMKRNIIRIIGVCVGCVLGVGVSFLAGRIGST